MPIGEIVKARKCGQIRFYAIYECAGDLNRILARCHLRPEAEQLLEIAFDDAVRVLCYWLHRDAAYGIELMSADSAVKLAETFMREYSSETSRYFTNGRWFEPTVPEGWQPLTDSVFDGGIHPSPFIRMNDATLEGFGSDRNMWANPARFPNWLAFLAGVYGYVRYA